MKRINNLINFLLIGTVATHLCVAGQEQRANFDRLEPDNRSMLLPQKNQGWQIDTINLGQQNSTFNNAAIARLMLANVEQQDFREIINLNVALQENTQNNIFLSSFVHTAAGGPPPRPNLHDLIQLSTERNTLDYLRVHLTERNTLDYLRIDLHYFYNRWSFDRNWWGDWSRHFVQDFRWNNQRQYDDLIRIIRTDFDPTQFSNDHARTQNNDVQSQEAITRQREQIQNDYIEMATNPESSELILTYLPSPDHVDTKFNECFNALNEFLDDILERNIQDNMKFRLINAKRTLSLINGDESIEHHAISRIRDYSDYSYPHLPTIKQLVVLSWGLSQVNVKDFVEIAIADYCKTPELWNEWKHHFQSNPEFKSILEYEDFGQSLSADREKGSPFINSLVTFLEDGETLPARGTNELMKTMKRLQDSLFIKRCDQIIPLAEALFMVMRGHNNELLTESEQNRPACAEGAYLNLLKSISEMTPGNRFFASLIMENCIDSSMFVLRDDT